MTYMAEVLEQRNLEDEVIRTLLYFDIFRYPLKADEVFRFLRSNGVGLDHVKDALDELVTQRKVFRFENLYSLHNDIRNVERRIRGNDRARKLSPFAQRRGRLISKFPFVRAVMASGSFSKDYMDEHSDLDFFVVTEPGKLWIARTLLVLFKRVAFLNSHKYFCINYYVDEEHLEIEEKNLFTATELATLIPLFNTPVYETLLASNPWIRQVFPNFTPRLAVRSLSNRTPVIKRLAEVVLRPFATRLERACMRLTLQRFHRMYRNDYSETEFGIAFKSKNYTSKNHPKNYQRKVMEQYDEKLRHYFSQRSIAPQT